MNEVEYLNKSGWKQTIDQWSREWGDAADWMPLAEAVEAQLAEDRARYNFMRERSFIHGGLLLAPGVETVEVCEVFQVKGRGAIVTLKPLAESVDIRPGDTLRSAVASWVVSGVDPGRLNGIVLRGKGEPAKGERLTLERKP